MRLGNRPNEGYAEMTACFYLPDGRVAFWFDRPHIDSNDEHNAGGLRFEVLRPFEEHLVTYRGPAVILDDPSQMEDPKRAFSENRRVDCHLEQIHKGIAPAWGGEAEAEEGEAPLKIDPEKSFARGHFEQHMGVSGSVAIGDDVFVCLALSHHGHHSGDRNAQVANTGHTPAAAGINGDACESNGPD